jgi:hypothetical protein
MAKPARSNALKPHQVAIAGAALLSLVLWAIPGLHFAMLPLQYLNTHLHEMCHAIVATATGGQALKIVVRPDGSGVTPILGGNTVLEASAGYIGATIIGALIMWFGRSERSARMTLRVVSVALALSVVVWVRGENASTFFFGIGSGIAYVLVLWAVSTWMKGPSLLFTTQFIGVQQCLNSVQSLYVLLSLSAFTETQSDAMLLQDATHVSALIWAVFWCTFSVLTVGFVLRKAWR